MGDGVRLTGAALVAVFWIVVAFAVFSGGDDDDTPATATMTTSARPDPLKHIPGDGVWQKYWGLWESEPAPGECHWSVLGLDPYAPATVLRSGTARPGEVSRVSVQPVSGLDVKLQTYGCGSWRLVG